MKKIEGRQEIAKVLNFGEYPVIKINMHQTPFMDVLYHGDKVRVDFGKYRTGERNLHRGEVLYNTKTNQISISGEAIMLTKDVFYKDYKECWDYASSPILEDNQEVVVIMYNDLTKEFSVFLGKTHRGDQFCMTIMTIE